MAISRVVEHRVGRGAPLAVVILVAACASAASPVVSPAARSPSPILTSAPSSSSAPTAAPTASAQSVPTLFTSALYGYSLTLPPGWRAIQAQTTWDGTGAPSSDGPFVDQLIGPESTGRCALVYLCGPLAWALAAPTQKPLAAYAKAIDAAAAAEHPCPSVPEKEEPIRIDREPGLLETKHCPADGGMLILSAVTVHGGVGYIFNLEDTSRDAVAEPADRSDLLALLATVHLSP